MTSRARVAVSVFVAAVAASTACGVASEGPAPAPSPCTHDLDCGPQRFCTEAQICRTDCFTDADCLALGSSAQCNAHGRCVGGVTDAAKDVVTAGEGGP